MRSWNLKEIETPGGSRSPVVLDSAEAARAVFIGLEPGQELGDHQVKEHAYVLVVEGSVRVEAGGEALDAQPGTLFTFETLRVPGHSPGHLAYAAEDYLFSGDVLFAGSVGRTDLPGADWDTLVETLRALTERFPPETAVYPGHGPQTTLGEELARNPLLGELRA